MVIHLGNPLLVGLGDQLPGFFRSRIVDQRRQAGTIEFQDRTPAQVGPKFQGGQVEDLLLHGFDHFLVAGKFTDGVEAADAGIRSLLGRDGDGSTEDNSATVSSQV